MHFRESCIKMKTRVEKFGTVEKKLISPHYKKSGHSSVAKLSALSAVHFRGHAGVGRLEKNEDLDRRENMGNEETIVHSPLSTRCIEIYERSSCFEKISLFTEWPKRRESPAHFRWSSESGGDGEVSE